MTRPDVMREYKLLMSKGASIKFTTGRSSCWQGLKGEGAGKGNFGALSAFPGCPRPPHSPSKI